MVKMMKHKYVDEKVTYTKKKYYVNIWYDRNEWRNKNKTLLQK